ncbi:hypothetical protein D4S03_01455 [bacterium]|nr:MAG: hypothetical protein D4S03_01455 [bacterium]
MYTKCMVDEIKKPNRNAKALSKLGASKGGLARKSVLTPEERREIAQKAVRTRWAKAKGISLDEVGQQASISVDPNTDLPSAPYSGDTIALFRGTLDMGNVSFPCYVLDNGKRVITQREVVRLMTGHAKGGIDRYLQSSILNGYLDPEKIEKQTVEFKLQGTGQKAVGYEGTLLVEICDAYLRARDDKILSGSYDNLVKRAEIIMRACAKVGIIALIDEATGFDKFKAKQEYRLKLQAFIAEDLQEWARMFPPEFWFELARLENIHYSPRSRPLRWGKYILAFVYAAVDEDVAKELKRRIPNPHYKQNLHQLLKEYGRDRVTAHLNQVLGVMKTCRDMDDFRGKFAWIFKKDPLQLSFFDVADFSSNQN